MAALQHVIDGPAGAPVLVLGPSLGTTTALFDAQVTTFADRYRVVRYDLPGHGGAPDPAGPCTVAGLAADVLALADRLAVPRFHYAGVSLGGAIGQELAIEHGERLLSLTLIATSARFADPPSWDARARTVRAEGAEAMVASRPGTWFTHDFAARRPDQAARLIGMLRATTAEGYAGCCEAIAGFDARDRLGRVTAPTLVVAGEDDPATPPDMLAAIVDAVPGARLVVVPGAAHLPVVEAAGTVDAALAAHLDAVPIGTAPSGAGPADGGRTA